MSLRSSSRSHASSRQSVVSTKSSVLSSASTQRKLNRSEFAKCYADYCHLQHVNPLQIVRQHLDQHVLDFIVDRVKFDEWSPIVSALRSDQTLHRIAIRLRQRNVAPILEADTDIKARNVSDHPVIITKFVLYWLLEALRNCLAQSPALTVLELEGLPLKPEFLTLLAQGVADTKALQHISLNHCPIGDEGVEIMSLAIRNAPTIISVSFSHCDLTQVGAKTVSKLISLQKLNRYTEAWKQTLRYRDPDIESMPGLRRLTLNDNPKIGDDGVQILVEEAKDDLWLRALDLQNIGMSDKGAAHLIHLVRSNPNLSVVDARNNPEVSADCLSEIMAILAITNADKSQTEFKWLSTEATKKKGGSKKVTSRSSVPRLWASIPKVTKEKTICLSDSTPTRSIPSEGDFSGTKKINIELLAKENYNLRQQLEEMNKILNLEIKIKAEILRENHYLKDALETCQLEKREIVEEFSKKSYISDEALAKIRNILGQLAEENSAGDLEAVNGILKQEIAECSVAVKNHTIWEEEEEEEEAIEEVLPNKSVEREEMNATLRAQEIFRKILQERSKLIK